MRALIIERFAGRAAVAATNAGDYALNPSLPRLGPDPVPSAVLVPLIDRAQGMTVLLTRRAEDLDHHPGQISFPGGRIEAFDDGPQAAALRETEEEIGLRSEFIDVVGRLADYETGTGFRIVPLVAVVRTGFTLRPSPAEVAEVFEVPLAFVLDSANHVRESAVFRGVERYFYVLPYEERRIWGATAGLLVNLAHRLNTPTGE